MSLVAKQEVTITNINDGTGVSIDKVEYASSSSGTTTPSSTNFSSNIPTVPQGKYLWTKTTYTDGTVVNIPTRQGSDGKNGIDGKSSKFYVAYADEKNGAGFSLTDNTKRYMGHYTSTETQSNNPSLYTWTDRYNVPAVFMTNAAPNNPPEGSRWNYPGTSNINLGYITIRPKERYIFIGGKWVKDIITSDNLEIKDQHIQGKMIKDKTITFDKIHVESLSAFTANLGKITSGSIWMSSETPRVNNISYMGNSSLVYRAHYTGRTKENVMILSESNVSFYSSDSRSVTTDKLPEHYQNINPNGFIGVKRKMDRSSVANGGVVNERISSDIGQFTIESNSDLWLTASNYTEWSVSPQNKNILWCVRDNHIIVYLDVKFTNSNNQLLLYVNKRYAPPGQTRMIAPAYSPNINDTRHCQVNADGGLWIVNPVPNVTYRCFVDWYF